MCISDCPFAIAAMCKRLIFVCFALVLLRFPDEMYAQFTDPRNYDNTPVGPFSSGRHYPS
jgi:hypothetical protein